jgi:hypothetical protein
MPDTKKPTVTPRAKRPWWRRVVRALLWTMLLVLIFHRPIVHHGGRWLAKEIARRENIRLDLTIAGNLWSSVEIRDVKAERLGPGPSAVEVLSLDRFVASYDIWKLIRGDLRGIQSIEVGTLAAELHPQKQSKPPTPAKKSVAEQIRALLAKPLPEPDVTIGRVDLRVKSGADFVDVQNLHLRVSPKSDGEIAWDSVEIPKLTPIPAFRAITRLSGGKIALVNVDNSPLLSAKAGVDGVDTAAEILGSRIAARLAPAKSGDHVGGEIRLENADVQLIAKQLGVVLPIGLAVQECAIAFDGKPEEPETWTAKLMMAATVAEQENIPAVKMEARISLAALALKIDALNVDVASFAIRANGAVPLAGMLSKASPQKLPDTGSLDFTIDGADLSEIAQKIPLPLNGKLSGKGTLIVERGEAQLTTEIVAENVGLESALVEKTLIKLNANVPVKPDVSLRDVAATADVSAESLSAGAARVDAVVLRAELRALQATLATFRVTRGGGSVVASGSAGLAEKGGFSRAPEGRFAIDIPALADFQLDVKDARLSGSLKGEGAFTLGSPVTRSAAKVSLRAADLKLGDAPAGVVEIEATIADGVATAKQCSVRLPGGTLAEADGHLGLEAPYKFDGAFGLKIPDLAAFAPLLAVFGEKRAIAGTVDISVNGRGESGQPTAEVKVGAKGVKFDQIGISEARLKGTVGLESAEFGDIFVANDRLRFSAKAAWKEKRAAISNLDVRLDGQPVLTGAASAPFQPGSQQPVPRDMPVDAQFLAKDLDIAKLLASLGQPPSAVGKIDASIHATGTIGAPKLTVETKGEGIRATKGENLPPTAFETRVSFGGSALEVTGTIRQPLLQPIAFSAGTSLDYPALLDGKIPVVTTLPLKAELTIPASALDTLPRYIPALSRISGTAAVTARVGGTIGKPAIEGSTTLDIKFARFSDPAIPVLTDFKGRIAATGERITFTEFGGEAGGGRFNLSGSVAISDPANPVLDVAFKSKDMLVLRDESILVRAEVDTALRGPVNAAAATGTVYIVQSRINKEIEILPLSLPGKPKPVPAVVPQRKTIAFPEPPLRDWTFNVAVKTRPDDPFLIRGNLARGKVSVDVRLAGTGRAPYLTGAATVEQFTATLPVSMLTVRRGLVTFSEDSPFEPRVEVEAESKVRQYTVLARVDGPASKPVLNLESDPQLPQQEILSLLTTGSLSGEIGANNTAMATRAAILVVKGWYKKLFKKDFPLGNSDGGDSFLDRFEVDFGAVDAKTGRNETIAQFRATDRLFFIGNLQLGGGFSGRVKYLFRFR